MVSRRRMLRMAVLGVVGAAGCLDGNRGSTPPPSTTPTADRTDTAMSPTPPSITNKDPDGTPDSTVDVEDWEPRWSVPMENAHALAIDVAGEQLFVTTSTQDGPSAVVAVDPTAPSVDWRTEFDGEAESGSNGDPRTIARDQWGVTVAGDTLLSVNGHSEEYEWTAVHALDRPTGDRRWSIRRDRFLTVHGRSGDLLIVSGREFFVPESTHDVPEEPLESIVYGIDITTGEVRWETRHAGVAGVAVSAPAIYVAALDRLVAIGHDGRTKWSYSVDKEARTVRATNERVYFLSRLPNHESTVYGLSHEGDQVWEHDLPVGEALLDNGRLFLGGHQTLRLAPDGSIVWRDRAVGQWLLLDPAADTLYTRAGRALDRVTAYDAETGDRRWTFVPPDLSSRNAWPLAATDGTVVAEGITTHDADDSFTSLYAVDADTGDLERSTAREPIFDMATVNGLAVLAGADVVAFDAP